MGRQYVGPMARLSADAIRRAEIMMLIATDNIGKMYEIKDSEDEKPEGWSLDDWLTAAEKMTAQGRGAEWDALMASIVGQVIEEVKNGRTQQPA